MAQRSPLSLQLRKRTKEDGPSQQLKFGASLPEARDVALLQTKLSFLHTMITSNSTINWIPGYDSISNHGLLSELLLLFSGVAATVAINRLIGLIISRPASRIYAKVNSFMGQVSKQTPSVKFARRCVATTPNWTWQALTWTIFILGYVSKSMSTWPSTAMYLLHFIASKYTTPAQKLILDVGWYSFTISQSWYICCEEYQDYISLGGGGTPQTWNGFKRVKLLGWFGEIDTLVPPKVMDDDRGFLRDLEQRPGLRPRVIGIAPQRQLDQRSPQKVHDYLLTYLDQLSAENSSCIHTRTSFLEKSVTALHGKPSCVKRPIFRTFGCEIAHPHQVDGSLHCMLHPSDIEKVVRAGWGERHSIARAEFWWMWWFVATEERPPIPVDLCFLYAPRSDEEVCVIAGIVQAGIKYVTSEPES